MSKRPSSPDPSASDDPAKKLRPELPSPLPLGDDMLYEVLGRADARSLARAACVCRHWRRLTLDERLWEIVCTRHWSSVGSSPDHLRRAVLAVGGFRLLHSLFILPLVQLQTRSSPSSSSLCAILPAGSGAGGGAEQRMAEKPLPKKWGKDEIMLSMSLLSTQHYCKHWAIGRRGPAAGGGAGGSGEAGGGRGAEG